MKIAESLTESKQTVLTSVKKYKKKLSGREIEKWRHYGSIRKSKFRFFRRGLLRWVDWTASSRQGSELDIDEYKMLLKNINGLFNGSHLLRTRLDEDQIHLADDVRQPGIPRYFRCRRPFPACRGDSELGQWIGHLVRFFLLFHWKYKDRNI